MFLYGPERSLPAVRREAWRTLVPDAGPDVPHPTAGCVAAGCRPLMVAYNLWLAEEEMTRATAVARALRSTSVRSLAFALPKCAQVSCNLLNPLKPRRGLGRGRLDWRASSVPSWSASFLARYWTWSPSSVWEELDLAPERTIEARLTSRVTK